MPVLSRFLGIVIAMYFKDHNPPHFHAKYGGNEATVNIDSGEIDGYLPPRVSLLVQEWRLSHRDELHLAWRACQGEDGIDLKPIAPLE